MSLVSTSKANKNCRPLTPHQRAKAKPQKAALGPNTSLDRIEEKTLTRNPDATNNNQESKQKQKKTPDQDTITKTCTTERD